jgi:2-polyprenyl-6-hydroxyphenyl methylase/3-demethylubiquinone-9 3-methyltransferase
MLIWGINIPNDVLASDSLEYLRSLPANLPAVEWVWQEMDRVWFQIGLNHSLPFSSKKIDEFYSHPVWVMNGLFTMVDPVSVGHRRSIASYLTLFGCNTLADYGGGFGSLAREITQQSTDTCVSIVEPYPSCLAKYLLQESEYIKFTPELSTSMHYDAVVVQDVLEHVEDPVGLAFSLATAVRPGGLLIFANCFYPVIQCHLPDTFHLRHTFPYVMRSMGLEFLGRIPGAEHAMIFRKKSELFLKAGRRMERISKMFDPLLNAAHPLITQLLRLKKSR